MSRQLKGKERFLRSLDSRRVMIGKRKHSAKLRLRCQASERRELSRCHSVGTPSYNHWDNHNTEPQGWSPHGMTRLYAIALLSSGRRTGKLATA